MCLCASVGGKVYFHISHGSVPSAFKLNQCDKKVYSHKPNPVDANFLILKNQNHFLLQIVNSLSSPHCMHCMSVSVGKSIISDNKLACGSLFYLHAQILSKYKLHSFNRNFCFHHRSFIVRAFFRY